MTIFFGVLGVMLVVGVWALYMRVGIIADVQMQESRAALETLKHELAILWVAISSEPVGRAEQRKEFGFAALYVFDELIADYFWPHRKRYQELSEELKRLESRAWDYTDAADREHKAKLREELLLDVRALSASLTGERKAAWDKLCEERLRKSLEGLEGKSK